MKLHNDHLAILQEKSEVIIIAEQREGTTIHSAPVQGMPIVPAWCMHDDRLIIGTSIASVAQVLSGGAHDKSLAETDRIRPFFEDGRHAIKLVHIDVAALLELALPLLAQQLDAHPHDTPFDSSMLPPLDVLAQFIQPTTVAVERTAAGVEIAHHGTLPGVDLARVAPLLAAASLPAVDGAQGAARTAQAHNDQKQIALAMHNFSDTYGAFPAGYSADGEGKPLLSWRVHILPFIEGQALYEQFHLDEAWDSPHNKTLIDQMPNFYQSPHSGAEQGKTTYLGVGGRDGVFVRPQDGDNLGTKIREITDGTSATVMTVEASDARATIWTRPGDFSPNPDDPMKGLRVDPRHGIFLAFADGSVRSLPRSIAEETLMMYFTKSGGEAIPRP